MRKVVMNKHNNLLQLEEHFYQLVDVDEPNTFRNLFPYEEIPKIAFNDRIVPHNMPDDIWIILLLCCCGGYGGNNNGNGCGCF